MSDLARRRLLAAVFLLSGFCGLVYESIWSHYLKLIVGHAAYAQAVVLVVFVGGMALGAGLAARLGERIARPVLAYALVEALVALYAFGFHALFTQVDAWAASQLLPALCAPGEPCHAMWAVAALLILPPSVLLGATFPLMCGGIMRLGGAPGHSLGLLYALNSGGAVLGVLCSGFVLVPWAGLQGTLLVAGAANMAVALGAWLAGRRAVAAMPALEAQADASSFPPARRAREAWPWLAVAAVTGLSSFIYEIAWIRMLTLVLGAATHSFELMLASFILGLALGGWWIRGRIDGLHQPALTLARIQIAMGLLAVATLPLYAGCFDAMALALRALARNQEAYAAYTVISGLAAAAVMLPAAFCAGMTLPLVTALLIRQGGGERQIGRVYASNTAGSIAGVLIAVHLLLPATGLIGSLVAGALLDVALGAAIVLIAGLPLSGESATGAPRRLLAAAAAAALGCVVLAAATPIGPRQYASGVFRSGQALLPADWKVLFHRDGKTATVSVAELPSGVRTLSTNGKPDGSSDPLRRSTTFDDSTVTLLGALGPAHHPEARRAALIGLGTGITSAVLLESRALRSLDTIEIEPMMVEAARQFRPRNDAVFDDPRSRIVVDDARAHFAKVGQPYDLIVSEPSNPWVSGVSGLFTVEFYRRVAGQLAPDGLFVQWLHVYDASPELVDSILKSFASVFPEFTAFAANPGDVVLVARRDGQAARLRPDRLMNSPGLIRRHADIGITSPAMLAAHEAGRARDLLALAASQAAPANSDYFPFVDTRAFRDRFLGHSAAALFELALSPVPVRDLVDGPPDWIGRVERAGATMPPPVLRAALATQSMRRLTSGDALSVSASVDEAWLQQALRQCQLPSPESAAWRAVLQAAIDSGLGLPPAAAQTWWQGHATHCARQLSASQRAWLQLFAAVAARDRSATREAAHAVLSGLGATAPAAYREYALLAGTAAHLGLGERDEAFALLRAQVPQLPPALRTTLWMRWIATRIDAMARTPTR